MAHLLFPLGNGKKTASFHFLGNIKKHPFYEYIRYVKPSPVLRKYCTDYIDNAIAFVTIEIGTPFFTVYEREISADFVTKIGALGIHEIDFETLRDNFNILAFRWNCRIVCRNEPYEPD